MFPYSRSRLRLMTSHTCTRCMIAAGRYSAQLKQIWLAMNKVEAEGTFSPVIRFHYAVRTKRRWRFTLSAFIKTSYPMCVEDTSVESRHTPYPDLPSPKGRRLLNHDSV